MTECTLERVRKSSTRQMRSQVLNDSTGSRDVALGPDGSSGKLGTWQAVIWGGLARNSRPTSPLQKFDADMMIPAQETSATQTPKASEASSSIDEGNDPPAKNKQCTRMHTSPSTCFSMDEMRNPQRTQSTTGVDTAPTGECPAISPQKAIWVRGEHQVTRRLQMA